MDTSGLQLALLSFAVQVAGEEAYACKWQDCFTICMQEADDCSLQGLLHRFRMLVQVIATASSAAVPLLLRAIRAEMTFPLRERCRP